MIPIVYKTKADYVFEDIRNKILNEEVQSGERLVVADLAREFGVSPMPVREALIRLAQENLVEVIPHVGARVINYDKRRLKEIHQIRIELEVLATRLLAPVITDAQCVALDALMDAGRKTVEQKDTSAYYAWNKEFHFTVAEMNPNHLLEEEIKSSWERMYVITTNRGRNISWRKGDSIAEHQLWVEALKTRDPFIAEAACRKHCSAASDFGMDHFD